MLTAAIDLGGTALKLGVCDAGRLTSQVETPLDGPVHLDTVAAALREQLQGRGLSAVGIAVPGIVDGAGTGLLAAHGKYAELHDTDLSAWAQEEFGCPATVENDARAALIGEVGAGAGAGAGARPRNAALLVLGTGIGTAVLLDGHLLRGANRHAGVLGGHISVAFDGPRCPCGNVGCAELFASTWAIREAADDGTLAMGTMLRRRWDAHGAIGVRDIVETRHEAESAMILDRCLDVWATVLVDQCHSFDPELLIVTGGVMRSSALLLPELTRRVHRSLWSSAYRPPLVTPADPSTSVLRGIAALASHPDKEGNR